MCNGKFKFKTTVSPPVLLSSSVQARDILATLYVNGRESTVQLIREGSHR